jgi:N-sulfoglucosamine sulfohydrolase
MKKAIGIFTCGILIIVNLAFDFSEKEKPNILLIIADDAGPDQSAYGKKWVQTPAFDQLASEGLLFTKAYTPNAKCAPSRSCLLTGRNSWQLGEAANHNTYFPNTFKTFPEILAQNGYAIGYTGKGYSPGKALHADCTERFLLGKPFLEKKQTPPSAYMSKIDYSANFEDFLNQTESKKPWCFWVGFYEPHRSYEYKIGEKNGKNIKSIPKVPSYLPDVDSVRNDLLDYAIGLEYNDLHLKRILQTLKDKGQLENTLVIVTSDHGMPFPLVKGNQYNHSNNIPLAIMWKKGIPTIQRRIEDYVSLVDIAPTILEAAGINWKTSGVYPTIGKSLFDVFKSSKKGNVSPNRNFVLVGQERHDIGRPNDAGYPVRGIHKNQYLYLRNYEPSRWPACNPETGYLNTDGSPTKTFILNQRRKNPKDSYYWKLCFGKRPSEELYDVKKDPDCVLNLAENKNYLAVKKQMKTEMESKLREQGDLRLQGFGHLYESYPQVGDFKGFYEKWQKGIKVPTPWVNDDDYEKEVTEN